MTRTFHQKTLYSVAPDVLLAVLTNPQFEIAQQKAQAGIKDCQIEEIERTPESFVYKVHLTEYKRGITGIDKTKTEMAEARTKWNLKERSCSWTYHCNEGPKVEVWGDMHIIPDNQGSYLESNFNAKINIPLVGGQIEKLIVKETEKFWPTYESLIREFCSAMQT